MKQSPIKSPKRQDRSSPIRSPLDEIYDAAQDIPQPSSLLLEVGDYLLLESGDTILLE